MAFSNSYSEDDCCPKVSRTKEEKLKLKLGITTIEDPAPEYLDGEWDVMQIHECAESYVLVTRHVDYPILKGLHISVYLGKYNEADNETRKFKIGQIGGMSPVAVFDVDEMGEGFEDAKRYAQHTRASSL